MGLGRRGVGRGWGGWGEWGLDIPTEPGLVTKPWVPSGGDGQSLSYVVGGGWNFEGGATRPVGGWEDLVLQLVTGGAIILECRVGEQ